jgi:MFS family permease
VNAFGRASFVALQHRNFRLLWIGLLVSFTGSVMQNAALLWHVSLLVPPNRKGLALGLVGLVRVGPIIVFSLVSGVVADAWDRRRLMLFTQTSAAVVAATLALLAASRACGRSTCWRRSARPPAGSICRRARRSCRCWCRGSTCRTRSA